MLSPVNHLEIVSLTCLIVAEGACGGSKIDACAETVATPGGLIPRECVHEVPNGAEIDTNSAGVSTVSVNGKVVATYPPCPCGGAAIGGPRPPATDAGVKAPDDSVSPDSADGVTVDGDEASEAQDVKETVLGCGGLNQSCCDGGTCNDPALGCRFGITGWSAGTCQTCGGPAQVCCGLYSAHDQTCSTGLTCYGQEDVPGHCDPDQSVDASIQ